MKKGCLFLILIVLGIIIYNFYNPSIILKSILGSARIIGKPINSEVFINDKKQEKAKIFHINSDFNNKTNEDYYVLYLRNIKNPSEQVYVIEKNKNLLEIPNSSKSDYDVIFGNLYQSESGANVRIPVTDEIKGDGYNPNLKIEKNKIEFETNRSEKFKIIIK